MYFLAWKFEQAHFTGPSPLLSAVLQLSLHSSFPAEEPAVQL